VLAIPTLVTHWAMGHINWALAREFALGQVPGSAAACASARSRGSTVSCRRFLPLVVHRLRAGQGPQPAAEKVATIAALPRWVHGVQDAEVFPRGQVTVRLA